VTKDGSSGASNTSMRCTEQGGEGLGAGMACGQVWGARSANFIGPEAGRRVAEGGSFSPVVEIE
jgi:hypothetical protein